MQGALLVSDDGLTWRYRSLFQETLGNETAFLFEPAARTPSRMIRPLADAMGEYVPHFAVNHRFETNAFVGCASDP